MHAPTRPAQHNKISSSGQLETFSLPFLFTLSLNKSLFEAYTQRRRNRGVSLLECFGRKSPDVSFMELAETRRHKSTAADLCTLALSAAPTLPTATSASRASSSVPVCASLAPMDKDTSPSWRRAFGVSGGGCAVADGGWTRGVSGSGIGRGGPVVEVERYAIARRKLGYSMGLILEARGSRPSLLMRPSHFSHSTLRRKLPGMRRLVGDGSKFL